MLARGRSRGPTAGPSRGGRARRSAGTGDPRTDRAPPRRSSGSAGRSARDSSMSMRARATAARRPPWRSTDPRRFASGADYTPGGSRGRGRGCIYGHRTATHRGSRGKPPDDRYAAGRARRRRDAPSRHDTRASEQQLTRREPTHHPIAMLGCPRCRPLQPPSVRFSSSPSPRASASWPCSRRGAHGRRARHHHRAGAVQRVDPPRQASRRGLAEGPSPRSLHALRRQ